MPNILFNPLSGQFDYVGQKGDTGATGQGVIPGGTTGQALTKNSNTDYDMKWSSAGAGDVTGPASAVDSNFTAFDSTTGKLIKDSGYNASSFVTGTPWTSLGYITRSGISAGTGISYDNTTGIITNSNPTAYTLPTAAATTLGGIKVGSRLSISSGVLSADVQTTDISGKADINQTMYIGTTGVAINRTTAALSLAGVSIDGNAGTVTNGIYTTSQVTTLGAVTGTDKGKYLFNDASTGVLSWQTVTSSGGDVIGPATNTDTYIPQWNGANSKTLKDGLAVPAGGLAGLTALGGKEDTSNKATTFGTINDTLYPSVKAVNDAITSAVTGTVTTISVISANGVSGTVANATTTPAITLALGAITPSSVNLVTISGSSTPTLAVTGTSSISGSNTGDQTLSGLGGANTALSNLSSVAINTSLISDTDVTDDLGSTTKKWNNIYAANLGATGTRLTKVWTAALESTALPTINGGTLATALSLSGTNTGDSASIPIGYLDTDGTLAGNSDVKVSSQKAVKTYVDQLALGLVPKPSAHAATTTTLPTNTYSNGASGVGATLTAITVGVLTVDGIALALNDYVLVKNETLGYTNGLYVVTTAGTVGVAYVLTRDITMNQSTEFSNSLIVVETGTVNGSTLWLCTNNGSITVGTTPVTFQNIPTPGAPIAGSGISVSGTTVSIDTGVTANLTGTQTLTNKTLTSPKINEAVALTSTATELNILDGATLTTTELNYVDGVTSAIQTQLGAKAASGVNADITSLTNLTTDLPISEGGTGASTAAAARTNLAVGQAVGWAVETVASSAPGSPTTGDIWLDTSTSIAAPGTSGNIMQSDGTNWGSVALTNAILPTAKLGYVASATTFSTTSVTAVQITGMTLTVTIPAGGRSIKITGYLPDASANQTASNVLTIWDGTVGSGTLLQSCEYTNASNAYRGVMTALIVVTPSAGSKTYNLGFQNNGGTSQTITNSGSMFILVELI